MLSNAGIPKVFWAEEINIACYFINRSPSTSIGCKTPEELWYGSPASYNSLFENIYFSYFHVNDGKLKPRA